MQEYGVRELQMLRVADERGRRGGVLSWLGASSPTNEL